MRIVFDESFDAGAWPGPGHLGASAGEAWLGTNGLLGTLEGLTGLARPWPSEHRPLHSLVSRV